MYNVFKCTKSGDFNAIFRKTFSKAKVKHYFFELDLNF